MRGQSGVLTGCVGMWMASGVEWSGVEWEFMRCVVGAEEDVWLYGLRCTACATLRVQCVCTRITDACTELCTHGFLVLSAVFHCDVYRTGVKYARRRGSVEIRHFIHPLRSNVIRSFHLSIHCIGCKMTCFVVS